MTESNFQVKKKVWLNSMEKIPQLEFLISRLESYNGWEGRGKSLLEN